MTGTGLAVPPLQAAAIPAKIAYARALADSGLLPAAYRQNPANVLWAVEYGDMIGISAMAAITGVHVIDGKPGASAGLISGLVRRAGHKLQVSGDNKSATCVITRCDDPKHPFSVTWTLRAQPGDNPSAELAGLLSKSVWKQYPAAMLKARAITQCARDACEEALFGLHYTPEELGANVGEDGIVIGEVVSEAEDEEPPADDGGMSAYQLLLVRASRFTDPAEGGPIQVEAADAATAGRCTPRQATHVKNCVRRRLERLKTATPVDVEDLARAAQDAAERGGDRHRKLVGIVQAHFKRLGYTGDDDEQRLAETARLAGTSEIGSTNDLDEAELSAVADALGRCRDAAALDALLAAGETDG